MKTRTLGRTGLKVSEVGHGLWGMGAWPGSEDVQSLAALHASAGAGCSFYDSAWDYGMGRSDRLLGLFLKEASEPVTFTSKIRPANGKYPASPGDSFQEVFPREHVLAMTNQILEAIGVSKLPLLQLHVWDDAWTDDPAFAALVRELKERQLIDHLGISLNRWEPHNGVRAVESGLVDTVQVIYNIFDQAPEDKLLPACRKHSVGVIARVPLDEGSLGGKLTLETRFPTDDWRAGYFGPENLPETVERIEHLKRLVPTGMSLPELALRFVLSNQDVSTLIVGMRKPEHIAENASVSEEAALPSELLVQLRKHRWDRQPRSWSD